MKKPVLIRLKEEKQRMENTQRELRQLENQHQKIIIRNRNEEHKARTRRLIELGAILENISPLVRFITNEKLQNYLKEVLGSEYATTLLETIVKSAYKE